MREWSPARFYLVFTGVFLVTSGIVGLAINRNFATGPGALAGPGATADIYGVFATNGWHSVAAIASGLLSLAFAHREEWARTGAFVKGAMYVGVTAGIAVWGAEAFNIASNTADQVAHATLAILGIAAGLATPRRATASGTPA